VEWIAERVDDTAEKRLADRDARDLPCSSDGLPLLDVLPLAEERGADVVLFEVEGEADDAVLELEHLQRNSVLEAVGARDAVADLQDGADLREIGLDVVVLDPVLQDRGDFFWTQFHCASSLLRVHGASARFGRARTRRRAWSLPAGRNRRSNRDRLSASLRPRGPTPL